MTPPSTATLTFEDRPDGGVGIDLSFSGGAGPQRGSKAHLVAALLFERALMAAGPPDEPAPITKEPAQ